MSPEFFPPSASRFVNAISRSTAKNSSVVIVALSTSFSRKARMNVSAPVRIRTFGSTGTPDCSARVWPHVRTAALASFSLMSVINREEIAMRKMWSSSAREINANAARARTKKCQIGPGIRPARPRSPFILNFIVILRLEGASRFRASVTCFQSLPNFCSDHQVQPRLQDHVVVARLVMNRAHQRFHELRANHFLGLNEFVLISACVEVTVFRRRFHRVECGLIRFPRGFEPDKNILHLETEAFFQQKLLLAKASEKRRARYPDRKSTRLN